MNIPLIVGLTVGLCILVLMVTVLVIAVQIYQKKVDRVRSKSSNDLNELDHRKERPIEMLNIEQSAENLSTYQINPVLRNEYSRTALGALHSDPLELNNDEKNAVDPSHSMPNVELIQFD